MGKKRGVLSLIAICAVLLLVPVLLQKLPLGANLKAPQQPLLPPCSQEGVENLFPTVPNLKPIKTLEMWSQRYHAQVEAVLEGHIKQVQSMNSCNETLISQPESSLKMLASSLPLWKGERNLKQSDAPAVLSEYLRTYECALVEYNLYLVSEIIKSAETQPEVNKMIRKAHQHINNEAIISRRALERSLTIASGIHRLQPLDADLTCLQKASLDIRNSLALSAEAASCLPRVWDTKDPLRDL